MIGSQVSGMEILLRQISFGRFLFTVGLKMLQETILRGLLVAELLPVYD